MKPLFTLKLLRFLWPGQWLLFLYLAAGAGCAPLHNLLWDGDFETGFGNSFWSVVAGNYGPNFRSMWQAGVLKLERPVASRLYYLPAGDYYLAAWVKSGPEFSRKVSRITLVLTNQNDPREKNYQSFQQQFEVLAGKNWTRLGFPLTISSVRSHFFHVELWPEIFDADILVDAVSLTPGKRQPEIFRPVSEVEAGFFIPEETCTFVPGEEPKVFLMIANHGAARPVTVFWQVYNYREEVVKKGNFSGNIQANTTVKQRLALADLPWGGYRLALAVAGSPVLADAFLAILPEIDQRAHPVWGSCTNLADRTRNFTARLMKKLGMGYAYIISASQQGRWSNVEKKAGQYSWEDETGLKQVVALGIEPAVCLDVFKKPPAFAAAWLGKENIVNEEAFTRAVSSYVAAFVRHYAGQVKAIVLEDETGYPPAEQLLRIYTAARDAAKKAAAEKNVPVSFSLNTMLENWRVLFQKADPEIFDFLSINSIHDPVTTARLLQLARQAHWKGQYIDVPAVGQRSLARPTSLLIDTPTPGGLPPSGFLWQHILTLWLNRPYGDEEVSHGPLLRTGYSDLRVMSASVYCPLGAKGGVEYDNSPGLGFQAVAMLKHLLQGMRPMRESPTDFSLTGFPTSHQEIGAYPFRNEKNAVLILLARKREDNEKHWIIKGMDFLAGQPLDFYGQPRPVKEGILRTPELPVYLATTPERVPYLLEKLLKADFSVDPAGERKSFSSGPFTLEVGPDLSGFFRLSLQAEGRNFLLLDGLECEPPVKWESLTAVPGRLMNTVEISFTAEKDQHRFRSLVFRLFPEHCELTWTQINAHPVPLTGSVRLHPGQDLLPRRIIIEQDGKTLAGTMNQVLTESPQLSLGLKPETGRLKVAGLVTMELPASEGQGSWQPAHGLRWQGFSGKYYLGCDYQLAPVQVPGSTTAQQKIFLKCLITAAAGVEK